METKLFEVRDAMMFIPVLAVKLIPTGERDRYLLARAGYGLEPIAQSEYVVLWRLTGGPCSYDPTTWGNRTMKVAHHHIMENFDSLHGGEVIDVEFLLGLKSEPKKSEAEE